MSAAAALQALGYRTAEGELGALCAITKSEALLAQWPDTQLVLGLADAGDQFTYNQRRDHAQCCGLVQPRAIHIIYRPQTLGLVAEDLQNIAGVLGISWRGSGM